jgi:hypothetical protein
VLDENCRFVERPRLSRRRHRCFALVDRSRSPREIAGALSFPDYYGRNTLAFTGYDAFAAGVRWPDDR